MPQPEPALSDKDMEAVHPQGEEGKRKVYCEEHGETLKMYCTVDQTPMCLLCIDTETHRDHNFNPISEAVRIYKNELRSSLNALKERKAMFTGIMYKQEHRISALKGTIEGLTRHVSEEFARMRRFLDEREKGLKKELAEYTSGLLQPLEENLRGIQRALISIQKDIIYCQATANQRDSLQFLQEINWLRERPHEEFQHPSVVSAKLSLGLFKGPLQYRVWKEMRNSISPVPAPLTLDPDTANPWLVLLQDMTSAGVNETWQEVTDDPRRFDSSPCVLASGGFRAGRHYWEVEVRGKTEWVVGVARESAERKGDITLSPQDGYWAVWLRNGSNYRALTSPPTRLAPTSDPGKVGVYLDYEGGQVSFYDADRMSHLYTFSAMFTEKLYPFFSPGLRDGRRNSAPVTVYQLKL
ncbi:zinc-binding protein A33-like isoform X1 [Carcharodon carcharias]|uniref:zinc-binding protein A33-like isoform X1 n=1 Tax=Carcharodon carcharias TaxID=13397 RepID=UPI001B7E6254|nr:zinc-binding protein A33-like isoform X1 [Carcharodon carcharias]